MGRPSVQAQRKEEILVAFEKCVAKFGVEGATLERIAEEAGLARPLLRHHVGNREELIEALSGRFLAKWEDYATSLVAGLPDDDPAEALIDHLFTSNKDNWERVLVAEALISSSATRPELGQKLGQWVAGVVRLVAGQIQASYPLAAEESVRVVATGVVGIYFNVDSLEPLGSVETLLADSKKAAQQLVSTLA